MTKIGIFFDKLIRSLFILMTGYDSDETCFLLKSLREALFGSFMALIFMIIFCPVALTIINLLFWGRSLYD